MRLQDKAIVITGSTTGIGEATARRCLAEGARVLIHGRDRKRGEAIAAEFPDRTAFHADSLEDPASADRIVAAAVKAFGKIDVLVNNAAVVNRSNLEQTDAEFFDWMFSINARAPLLMIRAAVPHLKQTSGAVLNIGSINAYCGQPDLLPYSMTKGALMTLTRNLANALGPDQVRVNQINVGWVLTPNEYQVKLRDGLSENWPEEVDPIYAVCGRILKPEEIAAGAIYWLSDESRPISGTVLELEQYPMIGRMTVKRGDDA